MYLPFTDKGFPYLFAAMESRFVVFQDSAWNSGLFVVSPTIKNGLLAWNGNLF